MSNQLDDLFKNKLRNRSFDYDESAWEEARMLIEQDEKKRKRCKWFFVFLAIVLISILSTSAFFLGRKSAKPNIKELQTKPIANSTLSNESINDLSAQIAKATKQEIVDENTSIRTLAENATASTPLNNIEINNANANTSKSKINANHTAFDNVPNTNANNRFDALGVAEVIEPFNGPTTTNYNPHTNSATTSKHFNYLGETANQNIARLSVVSLLMNNLHVLEFASDNEISELLPNAIDVSPTATNSNSSNWNFGVRLGGSLLPSNFTDFDGGVYVQYDLSLNWSLSFQPHYTMQQLSQQMVAEQIVNDFGFGLRSSAFSLVAESIRTYHAPLLISYAFGQKDINLDSAPNKRYLKHKLSTGLSYVYLDGVIGSIAQKESEGVTTFEDGWLTSSSFNRHNVEALFGYEYYLTKRLSVGAMARYRFKNQFSNAFESQNSTLVQPGSFYFGLQALYRLN